MKVLKNIKDIFELQKINKLSKCILKCISYV